MIIIPGSTSKTLGDKKEIASSVDPRVPSFPAYLGPIRAVRIRNAEVGRGGVEILTETCPPLPSVPL